MTSPKALIVEDNKWQRQFKTKTLLFRTGWEPEDVLEAETLAGAIVQANQHELALVSLDLFLGDSKGIETARRFLVETKVRPGVVWVVTADAHDVELRQACEALGVAAVIHPGMEPWAAPGTFTPKQKDEIREIITEVMAAALIERDRQLSEKLEKMTIAIVSEQQKMLDERRLAVVYRTVTFAVVGFVTWLISTMGGPYLVQILKNGLSSRS